MDAAEVRTGLVRAVGWFPLIGALVGAVTAAVAVGGASVWPVPVAVVLALVFEARLTGAFHEDAVADFCDAFGGGQEPDDVLRIMKDSRIGSYGALGLMLAVGLRAVLMIAVLEGFAPLVAGLVIVASASFGRLLAAGMMAVVPPAGAGLGKDIGAGVGPGLLGVAVVTAMPGVLPLALLAPLAVAGAVGAGLVFAVWFRLLLLRRIGGSTGDCLGFAAYAGQLIMLLAATAGR